MLLYTLRISRIHEFKRASRLREYPKSTESANRTVKRRAITRTGPVEDIAYNIVTIDKNDAYACNGKCVISTYA